MVSLSISMQSINTSFLFFFNDTATTEIYTLSLHDALPILNGPSVTVLLPPPNLTRTPFALECSPSPASITPAFTSSSLNRSEEHTSELQSQSNLVCRLLLEKKKKSLSMSRQFVFLSCFATV